jgi:hypothetical protein
VVHSRTHTQRVCCMVFLAVGLGLGLGLGSVKALSRHVAGCSSPLEAAPADPTPSHVASESQPAVAVHPVQPLETLAGHAPQPSPSIASSIRQQSFTGSSISIHCHAMPELAGPPQKPPPKARHHTQCVSWCCKATPRCATVTRGTAAAPAGAGVGMHVFCVSAPFPCTCSLPTIQYQVSGISYLSYYLLLTTVHRAVSCRR